MVATTVHVILDTLEMGSAVQVCFLCQCNVVSVHAICNDGTNRYTMLTIVLSFVWLIHFACLIKYSSFTSLFKCVFCSVLMKYKCKRGHSLES